MPRTASSFFSILDPTLSKTWRLLGRVSGTHEGYQTRRTVSSTMVTLSGQQRREPLVGDLNSPPTSEPEHSPFDGLTHSSGEAHSKGYWSPAVLNVTTPSVFSPCPSTVKLSP
jgi:hypothetical protein